MSGDVQPRKRKDKRKRKDEEEIPHLQSSSIGGTDEVIHVHKESKLGGNACAKIVFFSLLAGLGVMLGLIVIEYHGTNDVDTQSSSNSPWSVILEGWVDDSVNDEHEHEPHLEANHDEHDDHEHDDDEEEDNTFDNNSEEDEINDVEEENEVGDVDEDDYEVDDDDDDDDEDEDDHAKYEDEEEENEGDEEEVEDDEAEDEVDEEEDEVDEEEDEVDEEEDEVDEEEEEVDEEDGEDEEEDEDDEAEEYKDNDVEHVDEEEGNGGSEDDEVDEGEEGENWIEKEEDEDYDNQYNDEEKYTGNALNNEDNVEDESEEEVKYIFNNKNSKKESKRYYVEDEVKVIHDASNDDRLDSNYKVNKINFNQGTWKNKKRELHDVPTNSKIKYIQKIMERLRKEDKTFANGKFGMKTPKHLTEKNKEEGKHYINQENLKWIISENSQDYDISEEEPLVDDNLLEEDETSGVAFKFGVGVALVFVAHIVLIRKWSEGDNSKSIEAVDDVQENASIPPSFIERRQTLIPAEIMEDTTAIFLSEESDFTEDPHEDEYEEEVDNMSIIKETYEDLKASYNQITPEESEADINEGENSLKSNEYATTESEPETSESEEEEDEPPQEIDPLGQWKSDSGPELLAEEIEVIQTESETEESEDEASSFIPTFEGPKSDNSQDDLYDKSDITNEADWEIKDELDVADKELDDGDFPVKF